MLPAEFGLKQAGKESGLNIVGWWRPGIRAFLAFATIALAAQAATAQDEGLGLSFGLAPGVRWVQLPEVRAGLIQASEPFGASPDSALGWGIDGFVGYALGDDAAWIGKAADIVLRVRTVFADDLSSPLMPPGLYGQMPVDGTGVSDGSAVEAGATADSSVGYARYDVDLVYRTELRFDSTIRLRPLIGVAYSRVAQDLSFHSAPFNGFEIRDELSTNSFGGVLGLEAEFELPFHLYVDLGAESDLLAARSELAGLQNFSGSLLSAADESTDFVWRLRGHLGFGWTWNEMLSIGVSGTADWGRMPTVVHPLFDAVPHESFIDIDDSLVVGGNLTFSVVF